MKVEYNVRKADGASIMTTEPKKKTFTPDEEIEFEVAKGLVSELHGYFTRQAFAESRKESPNKERLDALNKQARALFKEHATMYIGDEELEAKARYVYGPLVRALFAAGDSVWQGSNRSRK